MEDIILVGCGGHAKSVVDCIERQNKYKIIGYTDIKRHGLKYPYLGCDAILENYFYRGVHNAFIGIGYMGGDNLRETLYRYLKKIGYTIPNIIDPSAIISESAEIGEGTFIGKAAIINAEVSVGKMVIVNTGALVEHECKVGDFSHVAVAAVLCGQVEVGVAAFVGANATIIQGRRVLPHQIVPAGATIR